MDLTSNFTDNPTLRYFRSGVNKDRYWNSSHTNIQFEDTIDCLSSLFPNCNYLFIYDQSSGHIKAREDGLIVGNTNVT